MKKVSQYSRCAVLLFTLCGSLSAYAGNLTSAVNRNQASTSETLLLTVTYDDQVDSSALDIKALEANFEILGVSPKSSSSVSVVNGQATRQSSTVWNITLLPKRQGNLTIPAFTINNDTSQKIVIKVDNSAQTSSSTQPLQVWVSASSGSVYPDQQLLVEVELSAQSNISNLNGAQLIIEGAEVHALDQQNFQRIDNGIARQVVMLKYAIFAKQPGELVIPAMTFTGVKNGRRSIFGSRGQQVVARSKTLPITVKELPGENSAPWFPADGVEIRSEWSGDTANLRVGEPVTRTITITARGQRANVIPPLDRPQDSDGYKSYKDQAQLDNQTSRDGFISTRIESEAIIPSKSLLESASDGREIILPELKLSWWNVKLAKWQQAILPAETLTVFAATGAAADTTTAQQAEILASQPQSGYLGLVHGNTLTWQLISLFMGLIIALQLCIIVRLKKSPGNSNHADDGKESERPVWAQLQKTLKTENPAAIRADIIHWAKSALENTQPISLQTIVDYSESSELKQELGKLDTCLYTDLYKGDSEFDANRLNHALTALRKRILEKEKQPKQQRYDLQPLYKDHTTE